MRRVVMVVKLLVAAALLAWLVRSGRLDVSALLATPAPGLHALGMALVLVSVAVQAVRWWILLGVQGIALPLSRVLRFTWIGYFYSLVLPGMGGGDVVRGVFVAREAVGARVKASTTVLVDRALGLYSALCLAVLAAALYRPPMDAPEGLASLRLAVVLLFAACTLGGGALLLRRVRQRFWRWLPRRVRGPLADAADAYAGYPRALLSSMALSLVASGLLLAAFVVAGRAVALEVTLLDVVVAVPLVFVANALPLAPGGVGVGEAAAAVLFGAAGVSGGATLMLTVRLWQAVTRLPGLLCHVLGGGGWRVGSQDGALVAEAVGAARPAPSVDGERA